MCVKAHLTVACARRSLKNVACQASHETLLSHAHMSYTILGQAQAISGVCYVNMRAQEDGKVRR